MKKIIVIAGIMAFSALSASAAYFNNAPAPYCNVSITSNLKLGSSGTEVGILQSMLARGGYLQAIPNGNFGPATREAVRAFQYDNGIAVTGTVGPMTRNAVNERLCDQDVTGNSYNYNDGYGYGYDGYQYASNVTVVGANDPYVDIVSPTPSIPTVYGTNNSGYNNTLSVSNTVLTPSSVDLSVSPVAPVVTPTITSVNPSQVGGTNIVYSPYVGYTYGITPTPGTLTVTSPVPRTTYQEGDTVYVNWSTNNLNNPSQYQVSIENMSGGQSKVVAVSSGNSASFVLSHDVLDAVCSGDCINYGKDQYRIVISTPVADIAGQVSTFKATVSPITIVRPYGFFGSVSLTSSKTPVDSGEGFKLYVNIPTGASWNSGLYGQYSFRIHAICPAGVQALIAGVPCGSDFSLPFTPTSLQQQIPVIINNSTWYRQTVTFEMVVTNALGQNIGTSQAVVTVNGLPFSF